MQRGKVLLNGDTVRHLRQAKGLSQRQLAGKAHVSKRTIERMESGTAYVRFDSVHLVARALEKPFEALVKSQSVTSDPCIVRIRVNSLEEANRVLKAIENVVNAKRVDIET